MFDLKEFRSEYNLTQNDLTELFGCKQSFISDIERGKRPMPKSYMNLLIEKFGNEKVFPFINNNTPKYKQKPTKDVTSDKAEDYANGLSFRNEVESLVDKLENRIKLLEKIDERQDLIDRLTNELLDCKNKYISLLEKRS